MFPTFKTSLLLGLEHQQPSGSVPAPPPGPKARLCSQTSGEGRGETLPSGKSLSQVTPGINAPVSLSILPPPVGVFPSLSHLSSSLFPETYPCLFSKHNPSI